MLEAVRIGHFDPFMKSRRLGDEVLVKADEVQIYAFLSMPLNYPPLVAVKDVITPPRMYHLLAMHLPKLKIKFD